MPRDDVWEELVRVELTLIVSGSSCGSSIGADSLLAVALVADWRVSFGDAYFGAMRVIAFVDIENELGIPDGHSWKAQDTCWSYNCEPHQTFDQSSLLCNLHEFKNTTYTMSPM